MTDDHPVGETPPLSPDLSGDRTSRIRDLNDQTRHLKSGRLMVTAGVQNLGTSTLRSLLLATRNARFDAGNDPHGEHDFGTIELDGERFFWKIDYYDRALEQASPDPANPAVTTRVLTLMLAEEY
jgi:hypothetical protein